MKSCRRKQRIPLLPLLLRGKKPPTLGAFPAVASCLGDVGRESGRPPPCQPCALWVLRVGVVSSCRCTGWGTQDGFTYLPGVLERAAGSSLPRLSPQGPLREGVSLTWLRTLGEPRPSFRSSARPGRTSPARVRGEGAGPPLRGGCPLPVSPGHHLDLLSAESSVFTSWLPNNISPWLCPFPPPPLLLPVVGVVC